MLNTEFQKRHTPHSAQEEVELTVTEDRLTDELLKLKVLIPNSFVIMCVHFS